jgi:hypothetical protein
VILEPHARVRLPSILRDVRRGAVSWRIGARALVLGAVVASIAVSLIHSAQFYLLVFKPALLGIEGVACVAVGTEAPPNGGVNGPFSPAWGLVDEHVPDTPGMGADSPREQALRLLLHRTLKERAQLVVGAAPLARRGF